MDGKGENGICEESRPVVFEKQWFYMMWLDFPLQFTTIVVIWNGQEME